MKFPRVEERKAEKFEFNRSWNSMEAIVQWEANQSSGIKKEIANMSTEAKEQQSKCLTEAYEGKPKSKSHREKLSRKNKKTD